jgi:hypothetical protein
VGPAAYNPRLAKTQLEINFSASKVKRQLFEPANVAHNTMTWKNNPPPGSYDYKIEASKKFKSTSNDPVFQSTVPNCKDTKIKSPYPPPGSYVNVLSMEE